jgi:hypothetical protein
MSSSWYVQEDIRLFGEENFTKEILSLHDTEAEAFIEEARLVDIEYVNRKDTYNRQTGGTGGTVLSDEVIKIISDKAKARPPRSKEHREKMGVSQLGNTNGLGYKHTKETKDRLKKNWETRRLTPVSQETRDRISIANTGKTVSEEGKRNISAGKMGHEVSQATRDKIAKTLTGTHLSAETKAKISKSIKGKKKPTVKCPHCDKVGAKNVMLRWHFDNCKNKSS